MMTDMRLHKLNRIAFVSVTAAVFLACNSATAFAAGSSASPSSSSSSSAETGAAKVVYSGNGTTKTVTVEHADDLDTFKDLMPGGSTQPQNIIVANQSSKKMEVYFQATPTEPENQKLLDALQLKITFRMDDTASEQTLYSGPASGKSGDTSGQTDIATNPVRLGYVYGNSESGVISAVLTVPETMGNQYASAQANLKWSLVFELDDSSSSRSGGGGGGGGGGNEGGNPSAPSSGEVINPESTPEAGPVSSSSTANPSSGSSSGSSSGPEQITDDGVPLSRPPKTGQNPLDLWILILAAAVSLAVFLVFRAKAHRQNRKPMK